MLSNYFSQPNQNYYLTLIFTDILNECLKSIAIQNNFNNQEIAFYAQFRKNRRMVKPYYSTK